MSKPVFISYARTDAGIALQVHASLREAGISVWLDQVSIPVGARWDDAIQRALRSARAVVVLLSPAAIESQNVKDEVADAQASDIAILPVLLAECPLPLRLRRYQYVDARKGIKDVIGALLRALPPTEGSSASTFALSRVAGLADSAILGLVGACIERSITYFESVGGREIVSLPPIVREIARVARDGSPLNLSPASGALLSAASTAIESIRRAKSSGDRWIDSHYDDTNPTEDKRFEAAEQITCAALDTVAAIEAANRAESPIKCASDAFLKIRTVGSRLCEARSLSDISSRTLA